jgi:predicted DCC family thiol-disulfide oxidoreductase YuxK
LGIQSIVMKKKSAFNKAMIYDDNCPLCSCYTKAFVKTGLLKKENRIAFSELDSTSVSIDWNRARHEIPLVDMDTAEVVYGIDAMVAVLRQKFFFVEPLLQIKPVNWFFRKLYKLVSYNRRIIVASVHKGNCGFDCRPDFNFRYRLLLLMVLMVITNVFLLAFAALVHLPAAVFYCSLVAPLLFLVFHKKEANNLELSAHYAIIGVIASFLLFLTACIQNFFLGSFPVILCVGIGVISTIVVQQIIRRIHFIKHDQFNEMQ